MPKSGSVNLRKFLSTALLLGVLVSCGSSGDSTNSNESTAQTAPDSVVADLPVIAVTYSVIGNIVSQLVGDNATVTVVISDGQDPHDFQPSAKDIETINNAALVVSNGLEFEEGLDEVLENIADSGGNIFMVGEHITVRKIENGDEHNHGEDEGHADEHGDKHTGGDPHIWLSPATMLEMLPALTTALSEAIGANLSAEATALTTKLQDLDGEVESIISSLGECNLVSGHDELGYFADRYGCNVVGAIIPSFTTTSEATAGELAELKRLVKQFKVPAIFTGLGTSPDTATQLAKELNIKAVTLSTHYLDGVANYQEFILNLTNQIAEALS
ncbi:MAG: metal ABC transporter substrate-binding protein [Ilumatobacteraceae bacterium]|jgi:zinc/manganese transport system substrate-binding protein